MGRKSSQLFLCQNFIINSKILLSVLWDSLSSKEPIISLNFPLIQGLQMQSVLKLKVGTLFFPPALLYISYGPTSEQLHILNLFFFLSKIHRTANVTGLFATYEQTQGPIQPPQHVRAAPIHRNTPLDPGRDKAWVICKGIIESRSQFASFPMTPESKSPM